MRDVLLDALLAEENLPLPVPEHKFALPARRWRLDWAWPDHRLALEIEGGVWTNGRHTRGSGFLRDMDKYNSLAVHGWRLLRCTPSGLYDGVTIGMIKKCLSMDIPATSGQN